MPRTSCCAAGWRSSEVRVSPDLDPDLREELLRRTMREARICAGLSHPSIVTVHDVVREADRPWIVMELLRGRALDRMVEEEGPLPPRRVAEIGRRLVAALEAAHATGVLHRDVKPGNVLVLPDGRVVLTDFGIAVSDTEESLTLTGRLPGSSGYVAPERLRDGTVTAASDLWSLGATLYFAVEGRAAFERASQAERLTAALEEQPDPMRLAGPLRPVLNGMLQYDPRHRPSGRELDVALASVADAPQDSTPTRLDVSELKGAWREVTPARGRGTMAWAPPAPTAEVGGDGRWWRLAVSVVAGIITLIVAPLLVEYLSSLLFPDDPPEPSQVTATQDAG
ncbi:serine/threonine-protein kinase [Marinactinospora thermotolerans]|uniref:non-specific serine/threonine protein kinase n=1 Tax=Marinactinospora thermotolerans DSM 45154 TaxID=1122192 RepID=A0A1T4RN32_9ACTN|nr:serine/threonine-protein kinase [Marinactinospora thermotolerans]SKA17343.1 Serine/threonine protein kinase [Marinactinospora thermotolerans DSM 45154]